MNDQRNYRLTPIDLLRGLVIVLMALDHVRDFTLQNVAQDPLSDPAVSPWLYLTRWITHFCAPVFIFLAGTSAGLMADRKPPARLAWFLASRGLWLIVLEFVVISTAITFQPLGLPQFEGQTMVLLQTLWAIGVSMIVLAGVQLLGARVCLLAGAALVLGHNLLDPVWPASNLFNASQPLWVALHAQMSIVTHDWRIFLAYPVLPWIGVMLRGFGTANLFRMPPTQRDSMLLRAGLAMTLAFVLLRGLDVYGDPRPWVLIEGSVMRSLMSFLNTTKYPPSLSYLLMTLGPAAILCACAARWQGAAKDVLLTFGRVPLFFYVAHFYGAHLIAVAVGWAQGFELSQLWTFFAFYPKGYGLSLGGVYLAWGALLVALYPACRWFAAVKARRRDWWLSYL